MLDLPPAEEKAKSSKTGIFSDSELSPKPPSIHIISYDLGNIQASKVVYHSFSTGNSRNTQSLSVANQKH